ILYKGTVARGHVIRPSIRPSSLDRPQLVAISADRRDAPMSAGAALGGAMTVDPDCPLAGSSAGAVVQPRSCQAGGQLPVADEEGRVRGARQRAETPGG